MHAPQAGGCGANSSRRLHLEPGSHEEIEPSEELRALGGRQPPSRSRRLQADAHSIGVAHHATRSGSSSIRSSRAGASRSPASTERPPARPRTSPASRRSASSASTARDPRPAAAARERSSSTGGRRSARRTRDRRFAVSPAPFIGRDSLHCSVLPLPASPVTGRPSQRGSDRRACGSRGRRGVRYPSDRSRSAGHLNNPAKTRTSCPLVRTERKRQPD